MAGLRVLIAEDEAPIAHLLDVLMRKRGYETQIAENGLQALEAIHESPPDIVLLDLLMPIMSGYQLLEKLRSNPETAGIPIVLVTTEENLSRGPTGGHPTVLKPFDPHELYAAVEKALTDAPPAAALPDRPGTPR